jgi:hypothetical protein
MPATATVIVVTDATVQFGDVATGVDYTCQATKAELVATPNLQTVPATGCQPETQVPAATGFTLDLEWLQDWSAATESLSQYLFDNDTLEVDFSVSLDNGDIAMPVASGTVRLVPGSYGGQFGTPLLATVTLPAQGKPVIGPAATILSERATVDA